MCKLNQIIYTNLPKSNWLVDLLDWQPGYYWILLPRKCCRKSKSHIRHVYALECDYIMRLHVCLCFSLIRIRSMNATTFKHIRILAFRSCKEHISSTELMTCKEHIQSVVLPSGNVSTRCIYIITLNYCRML